MTERPIDEAAIATTVRDYAVRAGDVVPPPLEELVERTGNPRRRWWVAAAAAATLAIGAGVVWQLLPGDNDAPVAGDGPIANTFDVPTYDWDPEQGGDDAEVAGTLAFTEVGCPLLVDSEGATATAVFFPNAVGVEYDNGVRAVADQQGRVYAIEGQEFDYGGGWNEPAGDPFRSAWDNLCAQTPMRDGAVIHDTAEMEPLEVAPQPPSAPLPTAPSTAEELGYFEVPTFGDVATGGWDPEQGGDAALLEGTLTFDGNCPVAEATVDGELVRTGLVFPNAEGYRPPHNSGETMVMSSFPDGSSIGMIEGDTLSAGGGSAALNEPWTRLCGDIEVESVFVVQDSDPTG